MSESDVSVILKIRAQGEKLQTIAALLKHSVSNVTRVVNGNVGQTLKLARVGRRNSAEGKPDTLCVL